jgi:hypothetical protein
VKQELKIHTGTTFCDDEGLREFLKFLIELNFSIETFNEGDIFIYAHREINPFKKLFENSLEEQ